MRLLPTSRHSPNMVYPQSSSVEGRQAIKLASKMAGAFLAINLVFIDVASREGICCEEAGDMTVTRGKRQRCRSRLKRQSFATPSIACIRSNDPKDFQLPIFLRSLRPCFAVHDAVDVSVS